MTIRIKTEERAEKLKLYEALVTKSQTQALTADELKQEETLSNDIEALDKEIELLTKREKFTAQKAKEKIEQTGGLAVGAPQDNASEYKELVKLSKEFSIGRALKLVATDKPIKGVEKEVHEIAIAEAKECDVQLSGQMAIPQKFIQIGKRKALTVATEGVDVVFTEYGGKVIPFLNPMPIAEEMGVTFLTGLRSNVQWPRETGDLAFSFETETSDVDESTPTFDNVSIGPHRFGGFVDVTMQMLNQSIFVVDPWLRGKFNLRYAITLDQQIFNGSGAGNQTTGLFNFVGVNTLSLGSGSANDMTYKALLSMKRDCKAANARVGRTGWVTNAFGEYALYNTPKQASGIEGNFILNPDRPGTLVSDPFRTSEIIASNFTEGGQTDLCGIAYSSNWGGLICGIWGGLDLLVDPYTQRLGGKVRFVANAFMDVDIEQPLEFAICKDWDATDLPALT